MMLDVLRAVKEGAEGPTRIMYRANLSWSVCRGILRHLDSKGLVRAVAEGGRTRYGITAKGSEVLAGYTSAVSAIEC